MIYPPYLVAVVTFVYQPCHLPCIPASFVTSPPRSTPALHISYQPRCIPLSLLQHPSKIPQILYITELRIRRRDTSIERFTRTRCLSTRPLCTRQSRKAPQTRPTSHSILMPSVVRVWSLRRGKRSRRDHISNSMRTQSKLHYYFTTESVKRITDNPPVPTSQCAQSSCRPSPHG